MPALWLFNDLKISEFHTLYNMTLVALSGYCSVSHYLGNILIRHTFRCHKSGKELVHFRYALSNGKVIIVYKCR